MDEVEVPPFFLCPISLELMKDPVTVPTGITYDRESIEKWLFSGKNNTCPVTKQVLTNPDLTPNHTLRRLIQSWCTLNSSYGVERIPTPKPPITKSQIMKLLISNSKTPQLQLQCLKTLRSMAAESETNRRSIEASGAVDFLGQIVKNNQTEEEEVSDEALSILHNLQLSESNLKSLMGKNGEFIESLTKILKRSSSYESRTYAVLLLKSMIELADPIQLCSLNLDFFVELVRILHDQISPKSSKASLQLLIGASSWRRNRFKAVEAGAVAVVVDLLLECAEKRLCELLLTVLDELCQCAEGRAELLNHAAGLAVVSKKIMRVSAVASERAVRVLFSIAKSSATPAVLQEMVQLGVVAKLCLVLQVDCGSKTKDKVREILKLHARAWKNSQCIPRTLLSSYPS